jgi:hypothetical protein
MHQSTLIVLLVMTLGQMLILAFGLFVLWLAGEFADESKQQPRVFPRWFQKAKESLKYFKRQPDRQRSQDDSSVGQRLQSWVEERGKARQMHR